MAESRFKSFKDVIGLWPSPDALASAIGAGVSLPPKWGQRDSIPADWWEPILKTRRARRAGLTAAILTRLAARKLSRSTVSAEARP